MLTILFIHIAPYRELSQKLFHLLVTPHKVKVCVLLPHKVCMLMHDHKAQGNGPEINRAVSMLREKNGVDTGREAEIRKIKQKRKQTARNC